MKFRLSMLVITGIILAFSFSTLSTDTSYGQRGQEVVCGTERESVFVSNDETHVFLLTMNALEAFTASVEPVGTNMLFYMELYGPTDVRIINGGYLETVSLNSDILSADGTYTIKVYNSTRGVGRYILSIGCKTNEGSVAPGDVPQPTSTPAPAPTATPRSALPEEIPAFDGIGFPGIAPVDMSQVARVPLPLEASPYGIAPLDNQIFGFLVDAEEGDVLDLSYTRTTGNMNLGLVVLSENNEVFFQASLVTSDSLSTALMLPEAGEYTIGVFRISLVEPSELEPTVFQISGSLNADE